MSSQASFWFTYGLIGVPLNAAGAIYQYFKYRARPLDEPYRLMLMSISIAMFGICLVLIGVNA